jgi:hypothetical protein
LKTNQLFLGGHKVKRLKRLLSGVIVTGLLVSLTACNSGLALYIDVEKGDNYNYHLVSKTTTSMDANGQKVKTVQDTTTDFGITVEDKDEEGNMNLKYTYDALQVEMDANGTKMSFDSKKQSEDNPLSTVYGAIIGKTFNCKMNKYGEVQEISGIDEMMNSILDETQVKDDPNAEALKEQIKNTLNESFGDEAIKSSIQQSTMIYPKGTVKAGDSWETSYDMKLLGNTNVKSKYTLDKLEGEIAYVTMTADMSFGDGESTKVMGIDMKPDLKGTITGNLKINKNNGFLCDGTMKLEMKGSMGYTDPSTQKEFSVTTDSTSDITFSTTKK